MDHNNEARAALIEDARAHAEATSDAADAAAEVALDAHREVKALELLLAKAVTRWDNALAAHRQAVSAHDLATLHLDNLLG